VEDVLIELVVDVIGAADVGFVVDAVVMVAARMGIEINHKQQKNVEYDLEKSDEDGMTMND
jgi:hypothetical protein